MLGRRKDTPVLLRLRARNVRLPRLPQTPLLQVSVCVRVHRPQPLAPPARQPPLPQPFVPMRPPPVPDDGMDVVAVPPKNFQKRVPPPVKRRRHRVTLPARLPNRKLVAVRQQNAVASPLKTPPKPQNKPKLGNRPQLKPLNRPPFVNAVGPSRPLPRPHAHQPIRPPLKPAPTPPPLTPPNKRRPLVLVPVPLGNIKKQPKPDVMQQLAPVVPRHTPERAPVRLPLAFQLHL